MSEEEKAAAEAEAKALADEEAAAKLLESEEGAEEGDDEADDKEIPLFMQESEGEESADTVPLGAHVKAKDKLKGKIGERDDKIEALERENEQLKINSKQTLDVKPVKRPRLKDFDTDDAYDDAMDEWEENSSKNVFTTYEQSKTAKDQADQQMAALKESVDSHYERAQKLVTEHSISPEVYKKADAEVRGAVAAVHGKHSDVLTDAFIAALGEGSEKALFYVGRNKNALNEFKAILNSDPTGLKVASFLGEIKGKVQGATKQKSRATPPGTQIDGGSATPKGSAEKRKYDKAHKSKSGQEAYNIKRDAKKAGIDTSTW